MELSHSFTVPASVDETWTHFNDIEAVASCFPGATVTSVEGDAFKGSCKVKLGPISLVYAGSGAFLEKDEAGHHFVIEAKGKDRRGNGTAGATVTAEMSRSGESSTDVTVLTDLSITGKPAQFGRGVMQDVSDKLLQQFVDCLESRLGGVGEQAAAPPPEQQAVSPEVAPPEVGPPEVGAAAVAASGGEAGAPAGTPAGAATARGTSYPPAGDQAENVLDLGTTVLPVLAKTYWKQALGTLLVLLFLGWLLRRRR